MTRHNEVTEKQTNKIKDRANFKERGEEVARKEQERYQPEEKEETSHEEEVEKEEDHENEHLELVCKLLSRKVNEQNVEDSKDGDGE